MYYINQEM